MKSSLILCLTLLPLGLACTTDPSSTTSGSPNVTTVASSSATPAQPNAVTAVPSTTTTTATSPNTVATADPNHPTSGPTLRTIGRFDSSNPNVGSVFSWPASTMLTRVMGTGIDINLASGGNSTYQGVSVSSWFDVFIDGQRTSSFSLTPGVTSYTLASNLSYADHSVRVVKRTEPQMGYAIFNGFVATGNSTLLPAPLARARKIEFIGDSITAGYGADGNVATVSECPNFTIATENADATFASMTAANFGADFTAIAFSGKGIYQNDDCYGDPNYTLPVLYPFTVPRVTSTIWDTNDWTPQAVVINLGTNDYNEDNGCSIPTDSAFTNAWTSFLKVVRSAYPNAYILCTVGPEVPTTNLARAQTNIQAAVTTMKTAGDANIGYVALAPDTGANGYGCAGHPNYATHALMADSITSALTAVMNW